MLLILNVMLSMVTPRDWKTLLPGAFAFETAPFAVHPLDNRRAMSMFHTALRAGDDEVEIVEEARRYLLQKGCTGDHIADQVERIRSFKPRPTAKIRSSRAWLVTVESPNEPSKVLSVFKAQRSPEFVREYMEQYYIDTYYSLHEKLLYARSRKNNPCPAEYEQIDGVSWQGAISCGYNPLLRGRLVLNLQTIRSEDGNRFLWEEAPLPQHKK